MSGCYMSLYVCLDLVSSVFIMFISFYVLTVCNNL